MVISKFNNKYKYKTLINKHKINKSKIIRKYSKKKSNIIKLQKGGAGTEPKNISEITDEYLTEIRQIIEGILDKETSRECSPPKFSKATGKEIISFFQLDNAYILEKIKLIPILNYFNDTPEQKRKNIDDYFAPFIIEQFFNAKDTYKTYKIKYNNKCYDIDRWKIYFDSNNLFKDFLNTKTNFDNIAKEAKKIFEKTEDLKKLEGGNEIEFLNLIRPIYIDLKKRFKSIIPNKFIEEIKIEDIKIEETKIEEIKDLNIGWNFEGVLNNNVLPLLNNKEIRTLIDNNFIPNLYIKNLFNNFIHIKIKNYLIHDNNNLENFNKFNFNNDKLFLTYFSEIINTKNKIDEINKKNIEYFFDDSNKDIIEIIEAKLKNNLKNLKTLYKVFPESLYDIYDHIDNKTEAIGTLNTPIIDISLEDNNIKILTYYLDSNLEKNDDKNKTKAKSVRKILNKYMKEDKADFICLQNFLYYNTDLNILNNENNKNRKNLKNHPLYKINNIDNDINNKISDDFLDFYDYIYDNNNFIFYNNKKFNIKGKFNKIILKFKIEDNYFFTIVVFDILNKDQNIVLINTNLPKNKTNNEINDIVVKTILEPKPISNDENKKYKDLSQNKNKSKKENTIYFDIQNKKNYNNILDSIKASIKYNRIFIAGNFERTIYSNRSKTTYFSNNKNQNDIEIDNSAYGFKLFKGLFTKPESDKNKSMIMYNIPEDNNTFKNTELYHDNILDNYGLQYKYDYYDTEKPCNHLPLLVTFLYAIYNPDFENSLKLLIQEKLNIKILFKEKHLNTKPKTIIGYKNFPDKIPKVNDKVIFEHINSNSKKIEFQKGYVKTLKSKNNNIINCDDCFISIIPDNKDIKIYSDFANKILYDDGTINTNTIQPENTLETLKDPNLMGYKNFPDRLPRINDHVSLITDPSKKGIVTHVENGKSSKKYPNPCKNCYITVKYNDGTNYSSYVQFYNLIIFGYANDSNREPQIGDEVKLTDDNKTMFDVGNSVLEEGKVFEIKDSEPTSKSPASEPPCNNCNIIVQSLTKQSHKGAPISAKYYNFIKSSTDPKKNTKTNTNTTSKTPKILYCYS